MENLSTENNVVTVNGRIITNWGESDPAMTVSPIDPKSVLRRGQGGGAVRLDRSNPGKTVTLNMDPASPDSGFLMGLFNSLENITLSHIAIGTLEGGIYTEGVMVNVGDHSRVGQTITDDQYIIEFNSFTETKGGE